MRRESEAPHQDAELFHRHADNPILTTRDWPYQAHTVFNAGACQLGKETVLLVRVEDRRGHSHLTVQLSDVLGYLRTCRAPAHGSVQKWPGRMPGRRSLHE